MNHKTKFTRMCIAEAILELMDKTEFDKIRVSAIVKRAGVARMSFYKHYTCPKDALADYMKIIISEYLEETESPDSQAVYMSYEHILYSLKFYDRYRDFFLKLYKNGMYSLLIDSINSFMVENVSLVERLSRYELYAYSGGLLNAFIQWEYGGKTDSAEDVASKIYELYCKE